MGDGGTVRVRATTTGAGSVLASVIALVEDAQVGCILLYFPFRPNQLFCVKMAVCLLDGNLFTYVCFAILNE